MKKIFDYILDLLFPKFCVGCDKEGTWLCDKCRAKIILVKKPTCPNCLTLTKKGQFCPRCQKDTHLTGLIVAAYYKEGPLKEAIHTYKYDGVFDLSHDLGKILVEVLKKQKLSKKLVIVPVPLHHKRQAKRGFNQAELLAKYICANFDWEMNKKLVRFRQTQKTQAELSGQARRKNVRNIFCWQGKTELRNKSIILVDDVYTTGATLDECAKVLKEKANVKQIWGLVLAKA